MTVVRNLAMSPDPAMRKAAYDAELEAWESVSVPLAAAMNGIKGEAVVLNRRRGWPDSLEPALFTNAVDRAALDAMHAAVDRVVPRLPPLPARQGAAARPSARRGPAVVGPVRAGRRSVERERDVGRGRPTRARRVRLVLACARRRWRSAAFDEQWVDAEARDGKRGGAFCMPVRGDESRVLMNFDGTFDSVSTLAHELGHAYHNTNLAERTPLQRQTPMALAETASIFCETILVQAGLRAAVDDPARAARAARHRPHRRRAGRGRHPLALPVRARGLRSREPSGPCRSTS